MIHQRVEAQVTANPHRIAAIFDKKELTYAELNLRANQLAHYLQALGVGKDDRVAICLVRSFDVLIAMLAILKAGGAYVPLDPKQPLDRLSFILQNSEAKVCLTHTELMHAFSSLQTQVVLYDEKVFCDYPQDAVTVDVSSRNLAYVIYTSGTTGKPKGVLIEHRSVVNYALWFEEYASLKSPMRIDWSSNYMFDMAVTSTIVPLMLGLTIVMCDEDTQRHFHAYLQHVKANEINLIKITPSYFKELLREVKASYVALPSLKTIILGGEQLNARDCTHWLAMYHNHVLINEYGPTEATVAFSQYRIDNSTLLSPDALVPIGLPGRNMYHYVFDKQGQVVACGDEGELFIGGIGLARGYLHAPELTAACFVPHPFIEGERLYKTGDLCRTLANGSIEYLGRIDRQVKIRGFRVELNEVEQCLMEHPAIQDAVVFVRENTQQDKQLAAYYILESHAQSLAYAEIRDFLLQKVPYYMVPVFMTEVDAFPMTANGKLDESLCFNETRKTHDEKKPRSNLERIIVKIWSKELGISSLSVDQNFWELGGHSFIAARIISQMNQVLEINILPQQFYEAMTVKNTAMIAKELLKHKPAKRDIQSHPATKVMPLSDFQTILWACKTFKPKAAKLNIIARKRFQGVFNIKALNAAFEALLVRHRILSYRISKIFPIQRIEATKPFYLIEQNLSTLADDEMEYVLWGSMEELAKFQNWHGKEALIRAKLFHLMNGVFELQIAVPHMIADGLSIDIIFSELSDLYLQYQPQGHTSLVHDVAQFSDYVFSECQQHQDRVQDDLQFWAEYLKDAHLFSFPKQYVVHGESQRDFVYSSYVPIPSKAIHHLEVFCMRQHVPLNEALSAVLARALINCMEGEHLKSGSFLMNVVKSARDSLVYDETIGCFIRIEPLKFLLNKAQTLMSLLSQVRNFKTNHIDFQQSLSLLKLASFNRFYRRRKNAQYYLAELSIFLYRKLLRLLDLNHDMLTLFPALSLLDDKKHFMVYLNIWNNFVNPEKSEKGCFGLPLKQIRMYQYDLLAVDNLFETCFLRDENHHPFVVISSNLTPYYRNKIAHEIIRIMQEEMADAVTDASTDFA